MLTEKEILAQIKTAVQEILSQAKVFLFGSRATGKVHEESDWDILILTGENVDRVLKKRIHHEPYPISLFIYDFIDYHIINKKEWMDSPSFSVLPHAIKDEVIPI